MPELPDITIYLEALERRIVSQVLEKIRIVDVFVLRTAIPPIDSLVGKRVSGLRRLGKRILFHFDGGKWLVFHLMIAGRLQWTEGGGKLAARNALAHFIFPNGTLTLTEAGTKHRASLHVVADEIGLKAHDRGGIDVLNSSLAEFSETLKSENHTLKRSLTAPHLFSGIGNAYSDEILHAARLSPVMLTSKLSADEIVRLHTAVHEVLKTWTERLRREV